MKIHENKSSQTHSKATCGYCRKEGHNQYQCPHVAEDWAILSQYRIPLNENGVPLRRGWHGQSNTSTDPLQASVYNNLFSSWFVACQKAMNGQIARKANDGKAKKRAKSKCGYCGSTAHTRRGCADMKEFLKDCYKANENWRRAAYKELVEERGLSIGACVKVRWRDGYWSSSDTHTGMGLITDINWNTLNLFSSCSRSSSFAHSPLTIKVMVDGEGRTVTNAPDFFNIIGKNGHAGHWYGGVELIDIVTPAKEKLDSSWITDYKESFDTLAKKKSLQTLKSGMDSEYQAPNLWSHVQNWKAKV